MSNNIPVYKLQNFFMFEEEEANKPSENVESPSTGQSRITEFRTDKPYRLALYVHPSTKRRINLKNPEILAKLSEIRRNRNKENDGNVKQTKKNKTSKRVNIGLFDEKPGSFSSREQKREKNRLGDIENSTQEEPPKKVLKESILYYVNINKKCQKSENEIDTSSLSKSKQKKMRKSYIKKCKGYSDSEKVVEPPSDEILKEIDIKKITKNKPKKTDKEEEEFEKWAENVNSAFEEIEKFELSVNYD